MRVVFRVDASERMGTGHVMRCLTLAEVLKERGAECRFIHRAHPGHMAETVQARGFAVHTLPPPAEGHAPARDGNYAQWLGVTPEQDAEETRGVLNDLDGGPIDWLVVDHYGLGLAWEKALRDRAERIAVIDDLANRTHDCDLLLDQNYFPDADKRYDGLAPETALRLCGPRYALLRPEYAEARHRSAPREGPVRRVLVFYGGADLSNETGRALRVLSRPEFRRVAVDVVVGPSNPHREAILQEARQRPGTEVHDPRPHLADLMTDADLAIGAGGTTSWERCALGLPSIVTAVAENQVPFSEALGAAGAIRYLGYWAEVDEGDLAAALASLLENDAELAALARRAWRITDGLGRLRVAEAMTPTDPATLTLRPAGPADKVLYFDWANDPDTRRHAFNTEPIAWKTHDAWFDSRLQDSESKLWAMITPAGLPVGQVRVDLRDDEAVLSYGLDPAFRGRGWGTRLLDLAMTQWRKEGGPTPLVGDVRSGNAASRRIFLKLGFEEVETGDPDHSRFRWPSASS